MNGRLFLRSTAYVTFSRKHFAFDLDISKHFMLIGDMERGRERHLEDARRPFRRSQIFCLKRITLSYRPWVPLPPGRYCSYWPWPPPCPPCASPGVPVSNGSRGCSGA